MKTTHFARGALAALGFVVIQAAHAHALPKTQDPAADATLSAAPHAVTIGFSEALEPAFSSIVVVDGDGKTVSDGRARIDASNRKRMTVPLTAVGTGAYTVKWVAVATDGHRTQGAYGFSVK